MPSASPPDRGTRPAGSGEPRREPLNASKRGEEDRRHRAISTASSAYSGRCLGMKGYRGARANSVDSPKIEMTTEYEMTLARMAGTNASASKSSRYRISAASSAAPSGVRNTAAMPAATPATIRIRRSRGLTLRRGRWPSRCAPPICIVGPSRPPDPPLPSVRIEAMALTQMTRRRTTPP